MKTIGLLGGMSWESTLSYYRDLNINIKSLLGGLHSAKIIMISVDFYEIANLQSQGKWDELGEILAINAKKLQNAGADCLALCTNTMHKVMPVIEKNIQIPTIHIADATGFELQKKDIIKVGLLGTAFTMEDNFYKQRIQDNFHIEVIVPNKDEIKIVHDIIYNELCLGEITESSKQKYLHIIDNLSRNGAQGIILGCTEIGLLLNQQDTNIPIFDTAKIHINHILNHALSSHN